MNLYIYIYNRKYIIFSHTRVTLYSDKHIIYTKKIILFFYVYTNVKQF